MRPNDWWARKLGGAVPPPAYPAGAVPPPPGVQVPVPGGSYGVQPGTPGARPFRDPNAEVSFSEAMREWNGGEGTKKTGACPRCGGSFNVVDRTTRGEGKVMGHAPAARCFSCGYNERFEQFSDIMTTYDGRGGSLPFAAPKAPQQT